MHLLIKILQQLIIIWHVTMFFLTFADWIHVYSNREMDSGLLQELLLQEPELSQLGR